MFLSCNVQLARILRMEDLSKPFYYQINDTNYNNCYLKVRLFKPNESDNCPYINASVPGGENVIDQEFCFKPVIENISDTGWVYSDEDSIFAGVCAACQAIVGVILNTLIFCVFLNTASFRKEYLTPFVLSLATTDLLYSLITLPIISARYFKGGSHFESDICLIFPLLYYGLHMCTMWNLVAITAVRCLGIYYPKKMREEKFQRKTYAFIFLAWFFAYFPFLVTMSGLHNKHGFTCYTRKCTVVNVFDFTLGQPQSSDRLKVGVLTTTACMVLLVVLNGLIYRKLYHHSQKVMTELRATLSEKQVKKEVTKEKKFAKTMAAITCLFFITYCPVAVLKSRIPDAAITNTTATVVFTMLASCSVLTDPMVYIIRHKKYRRQMLRMLTPNSWRNSHDIDRRVFSTVDTESMSMHRKFSAVSMRSARSLKT